MFLTSIDLHGFKSFAQPTTLGTVPGVNVVVGPNGSGKSNVVDALAWVLGTASPKRVRGGQMTDVIFAGGKGKGPASKARVEITIDNTDGRLNVTAPGVAGTAAQFDSIRVAREVNADGTGRYMINGTDVRSLDVQELLSDAGLGRELHTIVGQGQLDAVLTARPQDRRAFIEEAAGISKHRKRRARASRKIDNVDAHLETLTQVVAELRRQLRPLQRQAEEAGKARKLEEELREIRIVLRALDIVAAQETLARLQQVDKTHEETLAAATAKVDAAAAEVAKLEAELEASEPDLEKVRGAAFRIESHVQRLSSFTDLAAERQRSIAAATEVAQGRDPAVIQAELDAAQARVADAQEQLAAAETAVEQAESARRDAQAAHDAHQSDIAAAARQAAQQREARLRWEAERDRVRGVIAQTEAEIARLEASRSSLVERHRQASQAADTASDVLAHDIEGMADGSLISAPADRAQDAVDAVTERLHTARQELVDRQREHAELTSRADALTSALKAVGADTAEQLAAADIAAEHALQIVNVASGYEKAVAAVLADAFVAASDDIAAVAGRIRGADIALSLVRTSASAQVAGTAPLSDHIAAVQSGPAYEAVAQALARFDVVDDVAAALDHATPCVTRDGIVVTATHVRVPRTDPASALTLRSEIDQITATIPQVRDAVASAASDIEAIEEELAAARAALSEAQVAASTFVAKREAAERAAAQAATALQDVTADLDTLDTRRDELAANREAALESLRALESDEATDPEPDPETAEELSRRASTLQLGIEDARRAEMQAHLAHQGAEQVLTTITSTISALEGEHDRVVEAARRAEARRKARVEAMQRLQNVEARLSKAIAFGEANLDAARAAKEELAAQVTGIREQLGVARQTLQQAQTEQSAVVSGRHEAELQVREAAMQVEQLAARTEQDFELSLEETIAEAGELDGVDTKGLTDREDVIVRRLGMLGRVNPLALDEFKALEERHDFLAGQLDDLRAAKRDLREIIEQLDEKIATVFEAAYDDVAREFTHVFTSMFPGGTGRLELIEDPDDPLAGGIEIHATPPGKRVSRLSLLSGGERSLTVLAFIFAIFRSRPSPFYVLDEVDAALDDINLQRLLAVITDLGDKSQIIMVSHQKRSMECANVLFGITMGPDGITTAITEHLKDPKELLARGRGGQGLDATDAVEPEDDSATNDSVTVESELVVSEGDVAVVESTEESVTPAE